MALSQLLLMAILGVVVLVRAADPTMPVIGGEEINISKVPWTVYVSLGHGDACGGAIISKRWVLTVAHCTVGVPASQIQLRIGSSSRIAGGKVYPVEQVVNHDKYVQATYFNDISALKTASDIQFGNTARAVTLPKNGDTRPFVGSSVRVSGWGLMEGGVKPTMLRAMDFQIVPINVCKNFFIGYDEKTMICAGSQSKKVCYGDSGSPLVLRNGLLVGLTSYTNKECTSPADVYTDVAAYRGWIKEKTAL